MARGSIWLDTSAPCGKAGMAEIFHADAFGEFALNSLGNAVPLAASGWIMAIAITEMTA